MTRFRKWLMAAIVAGLLLLPMAQAASADSGRSTDRSSRPGQLSSMGVDDGGQPGP